MNSRAIHISSPHRLKSINTESHLATNRIWPQQFFFELSGLSADQEKLLNSIAQRHQHLLQLIPVDSSLKYLIQFLATPAEIQIFMDLNEEELYGFFKRVYQFFTDLKKPLWKIGKKELDFNKAPIIMGILNVTPDSFFDGGYHFDPNRAVERALSMVEEGATLIDIGGESTRPGSDPVNEEEEMRRILPVIEKIRKYSEVLISIDTYKSTIAKAALSAGGDIINDISAGIFDPEMLDVAAKFGCPFIAMHMQGVPRDMQFNPFYQDVCAEIYRFLDSRIAHLKSQNISRIIIDPGIGFGKRLLDNLQILQNLRDFTFLETPILIGVSRKSFIGTVLDQKVDQRLNGSLAAALIAAIHGADILRVHDVSETREILEMYQAISHSLKLE